MDKVFGEAYRKAGLFRCGRCDKADLAGLTEKSANFFCDYEKIFS